MINHNITQEHSLEILKKMCGMVGTTIEEVDFEQQDWYLKHTWTPEQQEEFRKWLAEFLKKHKYVRGKYRGVDHGYYEAGKFILCYGWKTE